MIESIFLRNYRGHTETTVRCGRLTVLVGENASGKTSVLRAVDRVSRGIEAELPVELLRAGSEQLDVRLEGKSPEPQHMDLKLGPEKKWSITASYGAPKLRDESGRRR